MCRVRLIIRCALESGIYGNYYLKKRREAIVDKKVKKNQMDDYFEENGIQKEETKQTQSYSGQLAGMADGPENQHRA